MKNNKIVLVICLIITITSNNLYANLVSNFVKEKKQSLEKFLTKPMFCQQGLEPIDCFKTKEEDIFKLRLGKGRDNLIIAEGDCKLIKQKFINDINTEASNKMTYKYVSSKGKICEIAYFISYKKIGNEYKGFVSNIQIVKY